MQEAFWIGGQMKIKWERNSRVLDLVRMGKIRDEDIIERTSTDNFPEEAATVRLANVRAKKPFVTVHIKGKKKSHTNQYHSWDYSTTMRVNLGGESGGFEQVAGVNGELDCDLTFEDVHSVVEEVKETMGV